MILRALVNYYEGVQAQGDVISKPGWAIEKISYALNLSPSGELLNVVPLITQVQVGKKMVDQAQKLEVPERVVRASNIKANFLCDNASYFFGFDDKGKPARSAQCFAAAKSLHEEILNDCQSDAARAVLGYFARWSPETARAHPLLAPLQESLAAGNFIFQIDGGGYAHTDPALREAWERYSQAPSEDGALGLCLVTGQQENLPALHSKIKGIPGAQSSGASLISYNSTAFCSYELEPQARVGAYAAFAYTTALNALLSDRQHRSRIGDTLALSWAQDAAPAAQEMFHIFMEAPKDKGEELASIMENIGHMRHIGTVDLEQDFYVLGIAPNAARLSVRFFLQDSFGHFLINLRKHYDRLAIVRPSFDERRFLSVSALLYETVNPDSRDKAPSPLLAGAVTRAILSDQPYPKSLLLAVMLRMRAERNVSRGKAAIIKACLLQWLEKGIITDESMKEVFANMTTTQDGAHSGLNKESNNRAYVLGRLFSVLEDAQKQALPGINTTIKDRYFTSACTTPGIVFPQLMKLSLHHTAKAEYGGKLERAKGELLDLLSVDGPPFPKQLSLEDQGLFILGYYQQTQARYTKKEEA